MFTGNLGWFDGDSANLQPLTRKEQAKLMARIAGGEKELLRHAQELFDTKEYQAALQLTGHLIQLNPENREPRTFASKPSLPSVKANKTRMLGTII